MIQVYRVSVKNAAKLIPEYVPESYISGLKYASKQAKINHSAGVAVRNFHFQQKNLKIEEVFFNQFGKPLHPKIGFNLSHSGEYLAAAFLDFKIDPGHDKGQQAIGIDLLKNVKNIDSYQAVIDKKFTASEQKYCQHNASNFNKIWTGKEAYLKYLGQGINYGLKKIEVDLEKNLVMDVSQMNDEKLTFQFLNFGEELYLLSSM